MPDISQALYTATQVRELDRRAIETGISADELMQRAGNSAWQALASRWPVAKHIVVYVGAGNNAGDGYVLAKEARRAKRRVTVVCLGDTAKLSGAAAAARKKYLHLKGQEQGFSAALPADADVLVDALLGTGLDRPLRGQWAEAVQVMNSAGRPVLALDVPSGLNADTGAILDVAVHATTTVTFIGMKAGLVTGDGPACAGDIVFEGLGVPERVYANILPFARSLSKAEMRLPRRERTAHKGRFGHVLVIGGNQGMGGAAQLTAQAALRSGAGLVTIATRPAYVAASLAGLPEAMVHGLETAAEVLPLIARATVIVIGPGLGHDDWGRMLLARALDTQLPLVADADALNLLAAHPVVRGQWVLTPHPGEASRLLNQKIDVIQKDRYQAAMQLVEKFRAVAVLKGAGSIVAAQDEITMVCPYGNPGMAAPGMGDVLSGVIAALIAQGLASPDAARIGVTLHALAGDRAARSGERGLMARDLIAALRPVMNL